MDTLLEGADPRLVGADLADDPGPDPGVADAVSELGDDLVGQVVDRPSVDQRLGGVVGAAIPAGAHHDVQAGGARQAPQPMRVAAHPVERQVDERCPAAAAVVAQLIGDEVLVGRELPVVPALLDVPEVDAGVLVREA